MLIADKPSWGSRRAAAVLGLVGLAGRPRGRPRSPAAPLPVRANRGAECRMCP